MTEKSVFEDSHLTSAFDRDIEAVQAHIMRMGGLVEVAISNASKSLESNDVELAQSVRAADRTIDELELLINEEAARLIALRSPTAVDLRIVLSMIKVSANLERIGDYAKNMAKRTSVLAEMKPISSATSDVRRMSRAVELMLKDVLDAYLHRDVELAEDVRQRDVDVDQMYNGMFRQTLTFMMEDPRNITACMHMHFIAKNVERMGDHVTSIAEQVIYLVEGEVPSERRPKDDHTPYISTPEGS